MILHNEFQNRPVEFGRCLSPLIIALIIFPFFSTDFLTGDTSLIANPEGENDRLDLSDFLASKQSDSDLLILTCSFEAQGGGALIKNFCATARFFRAMAGEDWNRGLGNRTVFLAHGLFLGETLLAM